MTKILFSLFLFTIFLDQGSKFFIKKSMDYGESVHVLNEKLYITFFINEGMILGLFSNHLFIFNIFTTLFILFIIFCLQSKGYGFFSKMSLSILLGATLSNFIDRLLYNKIVVFFDFMFFSKDIPLFNFSDLLTVFSLVFLSMSIIFESESENQYIEDIEEEEDDNNDEKKED